MVPQSQASQQPPRPQITLSPFYHSAVNAVTKPNQFAAISHYFVDRWMPLLGGNGTLIVLALRRDGFLNRKTGERREEIIIDRAQLAAAAGISEDTLTREMGINRKTGKPQNEWLHLFVQKRTRFRRDRRGQVRQEENAYWIAMDDPIHPDDWSAVEDAVRAAEERSEKQAAPGTQSASPVRRPKTQTASPGGQNAPPGPHFAASVPQSAAPLKTLDSSLQKMTFPDAAPPPGVSPSAVPEGKEPEGKEPGAGGDPAADGKADDDKAARIHAINAGLFLHSDTAFAREWRRRKGIAQDGEGTDEGPPAGEAAAAGG